MDDDIQEEIEHNQILIKNYRRRQRILEQQFATFGSYIPPHIIMEIDDVGNAIRQCQKKIEWLDNLKKEILNTRLNISIVEKYINHHTIDFNYLFDPKFKDLIDNDEYREIQSDIQKSHEARGNKIGLDIEEVLGFKIYGIGTMSMSHQM
jgi:hypothetical protein